MSEQQKDKSIPVSVRVLDKDYMVSCPPGQQISLISSAKQVDTKMREIRKSGKIIGSERIAVITALNLANELNSANTQVEVIDNEITNRMDELQQKVSATLERINASAN